MRRELALLESPVGVLSVVLFLFLFPLHLYAGTHELYLARGIEKMNEGRMEDALRLLEEALRLSPDDPETTYYAGVAHARVGNHGKAEELFLKTLSLDGSAVEAYLELGRLYYVTSRCEKAVEYLSRYTALSEDEPLKEYARRLINGCGREERPYRLDIYTGLQYDSNVILEPSNPPVEADKKADGRAVFHLKAGAVPLKGDRAALKLDYSFYQSIHFDLNDFNVHYHKIAPAVEVALTEALSLSAGYSLEYTLFGGDRYSRVHTYHGGLALMKGRRCYTEAIYEYRDHKYWDTEIYRTNSERTGYLTSIGLRQNFLSGRLKGKVYLFSDRDRTEREYWDYDGYRFGAEVLYRVSSPLYLSLSGEFNRRRYRDDYPGYGERRLDRMQQYSLALTYLLSGRMSVSVTESYTVNDSNIGIFDYRRSITGVFLRVGVL